MVVAAARYAGAARMNRARVSSFARVLHRPYWARLVRAPAVAATLALTLAARSGV
jgi:hypothetical protein